MKKIPIAVIKEALNNLNSDNNHIKNHSYVITDFDSFDLANNLFDFEFDWQKEVNLGSIILSSESPMYMKVENILIERFILSGSPSVKFMFIDAFEKEILKQNELSKTNNKILSYRNNSSKFVESSIDQLTLENISTLYLELTSKLDYELDFDDELYNDLVTLSSKVYPVKTPDTTNNPFIEVIISSDVLNKYKDRLAILKLKEKIANILDVWTNFIYNSIESPV